MDKKPVIGISASIIVDQGGMFPGYKRAYVNNDYVEAVAKNGGVPLIIPFGLDKELIDAQVDIIDGLILSGGHDVAPHNYGEEPHQKLGEIFPERDEFDFHLFKKAKEKNIPILGICRGTQIINVYEGGTLYQDLSLIDAEVVYKPSQGHSPELRTHSINMKDSSVIANVCNKKQTMVNSFHHQAIKDVAKGYKVTAKAGDGVVECIESENYSFCVGVQWHPEMLFRVDEDMSNLFKTFINESKK